MSSVFTRRRHKLLSLKALRDSGTIVPANTEEELGDLLFSVVNAARLLSVDPEEALTKATDKFLNRFSVVEKLAGERGITMENTPLPELDKLWDEAKATLESK